MLAFFTFSVCQRIDVCREKVRELFYIFKASYTQLYIYIYTYVYIYNQLFNQDLLPAFKYQTLFVCAVSIVDNPVQFLLKSFLNSFQVCSKHNKDNLFRTIISSVLGKVKMLCINLRLTGENEKIKIVMISLVKALLQLLKLKTMIYFYQIKTIEKHIYDELITPVYCGENVCMQIEMEEKFYVQIPTDAA